MFSKIDGLVEPNVSSSFEIVFTEENHINKLKVVNNTNKHVKTEETINKIKKLSNFSKS